MTAKRVDVYFKGSGVNSDELQQPGRLAEGGFSADLTPLLAANCARLLKTDLYRVG